MKETTKHMNDGEMVDRIYAAAEALDAVLRQARAQELRVELSDIEFHGITVTKIYRVHTREQRPAGESFSCERFDQNDYQGPF